MEAAAKKRGRPRKPEHDEIARIAAMDEMLGSQKRSRRGREDYYYGIVALKVLGVLPKEGEAKPENARWFCPGYDRWHWSLLAALGRVQHPIAMEIFAERLVHVGP